MKHFIAIHRFHNDEKRKEYCMSPERKDPPEAKRTVKEWADFACNTNPKAKCRSQWNGDEISFCHWEAESAQDILDWFDEIGLKEYMCPLNSMNSGGFIPTMTNLTKSWFIRTTRKFDEVE